MSGFIATVTLLHYTHRCRLQRMAGGGYSERRFQRALAAFRADSERFFALIFAARAGPPLSPPMRPKAAAMARISSVISGCESASLRSAIVSMIRTAD